MKNIIIKTVYKEKMTWNKDYKRILWIVAVLITIIIVLLYFFSCEIGIYGMLNLLFIAYTGLVITWYTKETFDLKDLNRKMLLSSIQPTIVAFRSSPYLILKNPGRGIAKNIRWKPIGEKIKIKSNYEGFPNFIEPHIGDLNIEQILSAGNLTSYSLAYEGTGKIIIFYQNERNDTYYSLINIKKERIILIKSGSERELGVKYKNIKKSLYE
ncbi:MAG: hypothetical protein WC860_09410 [Candidatus Margulisiibacteriota bacterium]